MTFLRHFVVISPVQMEHASTRPAHFFVFEFLQMAAIVALVLVISETVVPLADTFRSPERRRIFTRRLFAVFFVVHRLIYLMGTAKAFWVAEIPLLTHPIGRPTRPHR